MGRAVSIRHTVAPLADRAEFHARARQSRAHYTKAGCQYWLFEETGLPGAYVEFFEGPDTETLQRAHRSSPEPIAVTARVYAEVELT